jgi:mRNA interferase HigB
MILVGQDVLVKVARKNVPLRNWLRAWAAAVENAQWFSLKDVQKAYPSADGVRLGSGTVVTVFNVKGNEYRLVTWIDHDAQIVQALELLTHGNYHKEQWKQRY